MPEVCHDYNGFQWSLNAWKMPRNYSSSKVKMFTYPIVFLLTFYHNFISFFFFLRQIIVMILQACRPELFLEGSCRRFIMSWNTEPEQRTTESLTLSSSKKPENYRVSLFLPNSRTALAKMQVLWLRLYYKNVKRQMHIMFLTVYMTHLKCLKTRFRIFFIKV